MMAKPVRMTTAQLRAMISGGATRDELPASGSSVSSTRDSAQIAYLAQLQKIATRDAFIAAQKQTARQAMEERTGRMQSVADNSTNLPRNDAQNQTTSGCIPTVNNYCNTNWIRNNVVNPSSLFPNQPVNVSGISRNSTMKYGVNTNANYNTATSMNDFQSANPTLEINLGQTVNPAYYTAGESSIPYNNETNTDLLGGDIQHQETDVNTNLEYELPLSEQSQSNVNWAGGTSLGITALALGGLALVGLKK